MSVRASQAEDRWVGAEVTGPGRLRRSYPCCTEAGLRHWAAVTLLSGLRSPMAVAALRGPAQVSRRLPGSDRSHPT